MQYFVDGYPVEKRADAKVFDAGAGTGMVARGVGTHKLLPFYTRNQ